MKKRVQITFTLDPQISAAIDTALEVGTWVSRSALIQQAIEDYLWKWARERFDDLSAFLDERKINRQHSGAAEDGSGLDDL